MARIALVSAAEARTLDDDLPPLVAALQAEGVEVSVVDWDDPTAQWAAFDLALVRSTWDYHHRHDEFCAWAERASGLTTLLNPAEVLVWNTDKRYLRDLADAGVDIVPTRFLEPGDPPPATLDDLGYRSGEVVVKPAVSAGSKDTARYAIDDPDDAARALDHARRLVREGRVAMVQPYLSAVDDVGETAVVMVDGAYSHALRKGPLLLRNAALVDGLFAVEDMSAREASDAERQAATVISEVIARRFGGPLLYARVDLLPQPDGPPLLLELELTEPSLFFDHAPDALPGFARAVLARLG